MKSFIIIFALLSSTLFAESKVYFGLDYGSFNENFKSLDAESSSEAMRLKVGYGIREEYSVEVSFDSLNNDSKIFSNNDSKKYGLNIAVVKAFDLNMYLLPYFKAGFGAGYINIDREVQSKLNYGSFSAEVGTLIPINEYFDLALAYNYKNLSYESVDTIADKVKYESNVDTFYFGFNIRY
ncbi:MAG: porin family protein [Thiovulaceae bacterium]|nr:porin family protein [Sulfurimonadaceae bacterium]MCW9026129.1 porin family protein [Sulfurimonadaceae bacterium]